MTEPAKVSLYNRLVQSLPYQMNFEKSGVTLSPLMPLVLGVFVGILAAIMGVGGGFIMVPVMVYMLQDAHARGGGHQPLPNPLHLH